MAVTGARTTARGYGASHRRLREQWRPIVDAGGVMCWRCGEQIAPGTPWDLGHDDGDRRLYRGPEHANQCNRAAAGRKPKPNARHRPPERHPGLL